MTSPIADHIVAIDLDGFAHEVADISEVLVHDKILAHELEKEEEEAEIEKEVIDNVKKDDKQPDGKLILAEEIAEGHISWKAIKLFITGLGGDLPILVLTLWMGGVALMHVANSFAVWFLGVWGSQYETHHTSDVDVP